MLSGQPLIYGQSITNPPESVLYGSFVENFAAVTAAFNSSPILPMGVSSMRYSALSARQYNTRSN